MRYIASCYGCKESTLLIRLKAHIEKLSRKSLHLLLCEYLTLWIRVLDELNEQSFLIICKFAKFAIAHFSLVYRCTYQRQCVVRKEFGKVIRIADRDKVLATARAAFNEHHVCDSVEVGVPDF